MGPNSRGGEAVSTIRMCSLAHPMNMDQGCSPSPCSQAHIWIQRKAGNAVRHSSLEEKGKSFYFLPRGRLLPKESPGLSLADSPWAMCTAWQGLAGSALQSWGVGSSRRRGKGTALGAGRTCSWHPSPASPDLCWGLQPAGDLQLWKFKQSTPQ